MTNPRHGGYTAHLPPDVVEMIRSTGEALDLSITTTIACLVRGACAGGHCERFVIDGVERSERAGLTVRRRVNQGVGIDKWEPVDRDGPGRAKDWVRGDWQLSYRGGVGDNTPGRFRKPGEGWYLYGPGIPHEGRLMEGSRHDAQRSAARVINRHEAPEESPTD